MMFRSSHVAVGLAFVTSVLWSQTNGTISGTVTDASGSSVPNVKITATAVATGTKTDTTSTDSGAYTLPFLAPGNYNIAAEAAGFKTYAQKGVTIEGGSHPVIDIKMEIGQVTENVTVTEESPLVRASDATVGQVITTREVEDLPLNGRTPLMLDTLAMGAVSVFQPGPVRPFDQPAATQVSLGGAPVGSNETLLDGAPNAGFGNQLAYSPPQDAVTEVRVDAFESDASFGHTGGGVLNQITKSGTNRLHGSAWEFNQTSDLDANSFFNNKAALPTPPYHYNQYGITAGAPVIIPKVFNGKDKLFWFFAYEGLKDSDPANSPLETGNPVNYATVPTTAERQGNFSALLALGKQYQLYNPYSTTTVNGVTTRAPFANNVIPTSMLNPVSLAILQYYPLPNTAGTATGQNNYLVNAVDSDTFDNEIGRLDWNIGNNDKLYFSARHNYRTQFKNPYFGSSNVSQGNFFHRLNQGADIDEIHTFSSTFFMESRLAWTRYIEVHTNPSDGFDLTSLGFPANLQAASQESQFPGIYFSSALGSTTCNVAGGAEASFQCLGYPSNGSDTYDTYQGYFSFVKVNGNHTIKFGTDIRDYRWSSFTLGNSAGGYDFSSSLTSTSNWTNGPAINAAPPAWGGDFADFMLGLPTSAQFDNNTASTVGSTYQALFLQDDWRARSNLTLNLGIRFEHESPATELYNRAVNGFNPQQINPISTAAGAAYTSLYNSNAYTAAEKALLPPPGAFNTFGGLNYANLNNRQIYHTIWGFFSPRVGAAWTPAALGGKTVIRAGAGIFVFPVELFDNSVTDGSENTSNTYRVQQAGFSQSTLYNTNNYISPVATLSNPYPGGILPQGVNVGPGANIGQGISFFNPFVSNPYDIRYTFSIQRELPGQIVVEAAYIGSHSVRLPIAQQLDFIPGQDLSTSPTVRNSALNTLLTTTVANPFKGLVPNAGSLNSSTIQLQQLLVRFPQYSVPAVPTASTTGTTNGIIEQGASSGSSYFQSFDLRAQKRYGYGLTFINNFIWSRQIDRLNYLNDSDTSPEKRVSYDSRPLREVLALVYEFPIGRGKALDFHNGIANAVLGGWVTNANLTFQSGAPLQWTSNVIYYGGPLNFNPHNPNGPAFNISDFNTVSSQQLVYNIRTFDTAFNNLRQDPTKNLDASLLKNFYFTEAAYLQIRFEGFNVTNRVGFGPPNLTPTNALFGIIGAQANTPRRIQLGARLVW
ncbi:MAG TPA: TonB-dependent receptor [Bryobacteraceae bacterium]|nr:TonB-dependent receptor [Bryobacteraceae bacterium]